MKCPFCDEHVGTAARVCPHCRHELALVKALTTKVSDLEQELAELRAGAKEPRKTPHAPDRAIPMSWRVALLVSAGLAIQPRLLYGFLGDQTRFAYTAAAVMLVPISQGVWTGLWRRQHVIAESAAAGAATTAVAAALVAWMDIANQRQAVDQTELEGLFVLALVGALTSAGVAWMTIDTRRGQGGSGSIIATLRRKVSTAHSRMEPLFKFVENIERVGKLVALPSVCIGAADFVWRLLTQIAHLGAVR